MSAPSSLSQPSHASRLHPLTTEWRRVCECSKAVAERLLTEQHAEIGNFSFDLCIVRPSIISSALDPEVTSPYPDRACVRDSSVCAGCVRVPASSSTSSLPQHTECFPPTNVFSPHPCACSACVDVDEGPAAPTPPALREATVVWRCVNCQWAPLSHTHTWSFPTQQARGNESFAALNAVAAAVSCGYGTNRALSPLPSVPRV